MCTAGANESELHPLTAFRSDSGLNTGGEGRAEEVTQISTLCCLPDCTIPPLPLCASSVTEHVIPDLQLLYSKKKHHPKGYDT